MSEIHLDFVFLPKTLVLSIPRLQVRNYPGNENNESLYLNSFNILWFNETGISGFYVETPKVT